MVKLSISGILAVGAILWAVWYQKRLDRRGK